LDSAALHLRSFPHPSSCCALMTEVGHDGGSSRSTHRSSHSIIIIRLCCVCSCGGSLTRRKNNKPDRNVSELLVERSVALAQPPVRPSELTNERMKEVER
jgi:hypothetical protein